MERIEQGRQDKPVSTEWSRFIDAFVERTRGTIRDTTLSDYETTLSVFGELCDAKSPRAVDQRMAKRFVQATLESGRSPATVNKYLASLRRVWNAEFPNVPNPFRSTRTERKGGIRRLRVADRGAGGRFPRPSQDGCHELAGGEAAAPRGEKNGRP